QGRKGEAIPWSGRVVALVDVFESMTTTQCWREALPMEQAAAEIVKSAGTKFDPAVVEAFKKALPVMKKVREAYADALGDLINLDFAPKTQVPAPAQAAAAPATPAPAKPTAKPAAVKPAAPRKPTVDVAALAKAAAAKAR